MGRTACALSVLRGAERSLNQGHGQRAVVLVFWPRWWMLASEKRLFPRGQPCPPGNGMVSSAHLASRHMGSAGTFRRDVGEVFCPPPQDCR